MFKDWVLDDKTFPMNDLSTMSLIVMSTLLELALVAILPPDMLSVKDRGSRDALLPSSPV